jgi:hypothetical protein
MDEQTTRLWLAVEIGKYAKVQTLVAMTAP